MNSRIYLDYNATAPLAAEVREAMLPWLAERTDQPGRSAPARSGGARRSGIRTSRGSGIYAGGGDVVFTSGGTEADNLAITGLLGWPPAGHLVVSAVEHPAVLEPTRPLMTQLGVEVRPRCGVDVQGRVDPDAVCVAALRADTRADLGHGRQQRDRDPAADRRDRCAIARPNTACPSTATRCRSRHGSTSSELLGEAAMATLAGHKIGGPSGVGALVLRQPMQISAQCLHGGGQQQGRRPGTEPTALLVGMGAACRRAGQRTRSRRPNGARRRKLARRARRADLRSGRTRGIFT